MRNGLGLDVRAVLALVAGVLLITWSIGCPPPIHPNDYGEGGGGIGDDDAGDDDDTGFDNVQACEAWLASLDCGDINFEGLVDCSIYAEFDCDVADYFDCLVETGECDEDLGIYDSSGWVECTDLAQC
jgi:hypothetical protein